MNTQYNAQSKRGGLTWLLGCVVILGVLFVVIVLGGYFYSSTVGAAAQSVVFIREPQYGQRLPAGEPTQVRALARDDHKVTRIELWVDGQLIDAQDSSTPGGINPFPMLTVWHPEVGPHTLIARAYNSRGNSTQSTITVEAVAGSDRDADGVLDEVDACPDQLGSAAADGCPDRDFDGIADDRDACPDAAGLPADGCPAPSATDRDGDGVADGADACPDVAGSPLADGCTDADGDGIGDPSDSCPAEPGDGADGCIEAGGSGVEPDVAPSGGEPEPLPGEEPPVPGDDEEAEPGSGFGDMGFELDPGIPVEVEVEATMLYIQQPYDRVWCYVRFGDGDPHRYEFETSGDQFWNADEVLGGANSVHLLHSSNEPLRIELSCMGAFAGGIPEELGETQAEHPQAEWDGRLFTLAPEGAHLYEARYHICSPACDEVALQIPQLAPVSTGPIGHGPYTLGWRWDGDESQIDGFAVKFYDEAGWDHNIYLYHPESRTMDIADYQPACGETVSFTMVSFAMVEGHFIASPPSNKVEWTARPCTYTASVTFTTLEVHDPPADEDGLHRPGPIYGNFWAASGSTDRSLEFDACWRPSGPFAWARDCQGLKLEGRTYSIYRDIFDWIHTQQASCLGSGCRSNSFSAPETSTIILPYEDGGDITIGGLVMDCDSGNADDTVFQEQRTIRINVSELANLTSPISGVIPGDHINLGYTIRLGH
jgi:hypothetical protein